MKVFKIKARYGRGEMTCKMLIAANCLSGAKLMANKECPVPVMSIKNDIEASEIKGLTFNSRLPILITRV